MIWYVVMVCTRYIPNGMLNLRTSRGPLLSAKIHHILKKKYIPLEDSTNIQHIPSRYVPGIYQVHTMYIHGMRTLYGPGSRNVCSMSTSQNVHFVHRHFAEGNFAKQTLRSWTLCGQKI